MAWRFLTPTHEAAAQITNGWQRSLSSMRAATKNPRIATACSCAHCRDARPLFSVTRATLKR